MSKNSRNMTARRWKLRGGKRRVLGIALLTIGLLIAALWVSSAWFAWRIGGDDWWMQMSHGVFQVAVGPGAAGWSFYTPYAPPPLLSALAPEWSWLAKGTTPSAPGFNFGIVAGDMPINSAGQTRWINISGWVLALLPLLLGLWLRLKRGWAIGRCQTCGYDRTGITSITNCPECGKSGVAQTTAATPAPPQPSKPPAL